VKGQAFHSATIALATLKAMMPENHCTLLSEEVPEKLEAMGARSDGATVQ